MMPQDSDEFSEGYTTLKHKALITGDPVAPLVLLVHGRAGDRNVMWTFKRCIPDGVSIIAPEAPISDPIGGFSWWLMDETLSKEDKLVAIINAAARLNDFLEKALVHYRLMPSKIIAFGFSQGAALLSANIQTWQNFVGVALLAGFVVELENRLMLPNVFIAHGTKDEAVPLEKAKRGAEYLKTLGAELELVTDEVGHKVGTAGMHALKNWTARILSGA